MKAPTAPFNRLNTECKSLNILNFYICPKVTTYILRDTEVSIFVASINDELAARRSEIIAAKSSETHSAISAMVQLFRDQIQEAKNFENTSPEAELNLLSNLATFEEALHDFPPSRVVYFEHEYSMNSPGLGFLIINESKERAVLVEYTNDLG